MKNSLAILLLVLFSIPGFSQELGYNVRGRYTRPVKKEAFRSAKFIKDVISSYPVNWITGYTSVEILATCNGKAMKAVSKNDTLSAEQKNILNTVDLATDIVINVEYTYKVPVTDMVENNRMHASMTIVPEVEAEFVGGHQQLMNYLKKNGIDKISGTIVKQPQQLIILFTVNEGGEIINAGITQTFGDLETDKLLLEVIRKMPRWRPAETSKGIKVKQEFEFSVCKAGGC